LKSAIRAALIVIALTIGSFIVSCRLIADEYDQGGLGMVTSDELRQEPVRFELDIPFAATGNPRQRLDLYLPKKPASDKLPVIVFIHGGGWLGGDKADGAARLTPFVRGGEYAGVSVEYRLLNEAIWPAQIHDCKAAIRWIRAHAGAYGLDPERIAVWGWSAGAHLALMLGFTGDAPELEGDVGPHNDMASKVSGVVNFFGVTDIPAIIGQPSDIDRTSRRAPEARLIGGALLENLEKARAASPIAHVSPNDPPVLTIHGDADPIVPYDQAVRLDKALKKAGVQSYFISVAGAGHGGLPDEAVERAGDFFSKILLGKDVKISTETLNQPVSD
jgi:acetyl esterase/lipase